MKSAQKESCNYLYTCQGNLELLQISYKLTKKKTSVEGEQKIGIINGIKLVNSCMGDTKEDMKI